ncbi:MAG: hypothetical protein JWN56_2767 [Sphingobacteriales bacterium]|nr:hypothetical protein [Sphingobacteriales bacterium]
MTLVYNNSAKRLRILVLGYIIRGPIGGMTWHHLQYFLGLYQMGHDVYFLEDSGNTAYCCYDPQRNITDKDPAYGLDYALHVFKRVGLEKRWAYYNHHTHNWQGPLGKKALNIIASADMLLNLSCSNPIRPWLEGVPVRALIDTDPVFTQIRNLIDLQRKELSNQHNVFFTFGENYGQQDCEIPNDGFPWQPTRQPIVLDAWPVLPSSHKSSFTTVMKWESYPGHLYDGRYFGMKGDSFADYWTIPSQSNYPLEMAMSDDTAPRQLLLDNGWHVSNPFDISTDPWKYQGYIQRSRAEFSIAKHGYVVGKTGWFSERSAGYLASGRPVVLQDTGFSKWVETKKGLFPFKNIEEALEGIKSVSKDYQHHCIAARKLAEEYFNAPDVLNHLIHKSYQIIK